MSGEQWSYGSTYTYEDQVQHETQEDEKHKALTVKPLFLRQTAEIIPEDQSCILTDLFTNSGIQLNGLGLNGSTVSKEGLLMRIFSKK